MWMIYITTSLILHIVYFTEVTMICPKEEDTNYKMQRPSHNQPYFTYSKDNSKDV